MDNPRVLTGCRSPSLLYSIAEPLSDKDQKPIFLDVREYLRQIATTPAPLQAIHEDAKRNGTDQLTMEQINREVAAVRRKHDKKMITKRPGD